ncbi:MAG: phycobiliprotein lyase [Geitlerinemataceae cyanobacterium]
MRLSPMVSSGQVELLSTQSLVEAFFRKSAGNWKSERRYYTLKKDTSQEVVSFITIEFLERGDARLLPLAELHHLREEQVLACGSQVIWESHYVGPKGKPTKGSTVFGVLGETLYRDRGFATPEPVTAHLYLPKPQTLCLKTEYGGSVFEEEIKLIGQKYRTRQTIISRAGEELTIGQYLEKRV